MRGSRTRGDARRETRRDRRQSSDVRLEKRGNHRAKREIPRRGSSEGTLARGEPARGGARPSDRSCTRARRRDERDAGASGTRGARQGPLTRRGQPRATRTSGERDRPRRRAPRDSSRTAVRRFAPRAAGARGGGNEARALFRPSVGGFDRAARLGPTERPPRAAIAPRVGIAANSPPPGRVPRAQTARRGGRTGKTGRGGGGHVPGGRTPREGEGGW